METKNAVSSQEDFEKVVLAALKELHFETEVEPMGPEQTPDIVARSGDKIIIIETKIGNPSATIPSISLPQAIDYFEAAKSKYRSNKVSTIVITNQKVPERLKQIFSANGVVVGSVSSFDISEIKELISDSLKQTA